MQVACRSVRVAWTALFLVEVRVGSKPINHVWRLLSFCFSWDEFHGHVAQLGVNPAPSQQGPPFVKINLHRSPHRGPSGNCKALPHDGSPSARLMT